MAVTSGVRLEEGGWLRATGSRLWRRRRRGSGSVACFPRPAVSGLPITFYSCRTGLSVDGIVSSSQRLPTQPGNLARGDPLNPSYGRSSCRSRTMSRKSSGKRSAIAIVILIRYRPGIRKSVCGYKSGPGLVPARRFAADYRSSYPIRTHHTAPAERSRVVAQLPQISWQSNNTVVNGLSAFTSI